MFASDLDEEVIALLRADPEFREPTAREVALFQVEQITLTNRAVAMSQAGQIRALNAFGVATIARVAAERAVEENPPPVERAWCDGFEQACAEISMAMCIAGPTASNRLGEAMELSARFPRVLDALGRGEITLTAVRIITDQTADLTPGQAAAVADRMLPYATSKPPGRFREALRKAVMVVDLDALKRRAKKAVEDRGVWLRDLADGMAQVSIVTTAAEATAMYAVVDELARDCRHDTPANPHQEESAVDRDGRTQANRRADVVVDLICGPVTGYTAAGSTANESTRGPLWRRNVKVDVRTTIPFSTLFGIDDQPGHLTGYGPIPADQARELAAHGTWRRILTDPVTGAPVDFGTTKYRPPAALRDAILTKYQVCERPGCTMRADQCDLDHHQPHHVSGVTTLDGTGPKCRRDHRLKQTPGWHVEHHPGGSTTWHTPSGRTYSSKPEPIAEPITTPGPRPAPHTVTWAAGNPADDDADPPPF